MYLYYLIHLKHYSERGSIGLTRQSRGLEHKYRFKILRYMKGPREQREINSEFLKILLIQQDNNNSLQFCSKYGKKKRRNQSLIQGELTNTALG